MSDENIPASVKMCGECPTCRYTRSAEKPNFRYRVSRFIQKNLCPACRAANKKLGRDFQKSTKFEE
ncbi:MAG: hypothetical protein JW803_01185 [Endomicrobiales bacterium]|nr:hypothetical protein [Endomicrobiales bacterium]